MGGWANDTFIRTTNMTTLEQAIRQVLALDGYKPIAKPTPEESFYRTTSRYGEQTYLKDDLCGVLLISGTSKDQAWSYIQCAPNSLLCERARGIEHPMLAEVAKILQVDAFRLEVEDGDSVVLLECSHNGEFRVSGALMSMLEEAYNNHPDEATEPPIKYFEEDVQGDYPVFELLSDLKPFSPENFRNPERAVAEIGGEFFRSDNVPLNWNRLFSAEPVDFTDPTIYELYFRQGD